MDLNNIGRDCPCYEFDNSEMSFDIGEFNGLAPNNGKLTVNVNGVEAGEFYANQQEDTTIDIQTVTQQDINNAVSSEATIRERADRDLQANIDGERLARQQADNGLQAQIDAIASKSDVVDVVGTYAELQAYDTSKLDDNDVVKVLDDSTHNGSMTYYRWNETTQTWSYIGQESPYYSKSQTDTLLAQKQDNLTAGTGITLNGSTISADTTVLAEKSELDNYAEKANTYTKTEVDNLVEPKLSVEVAEQLPVQGDQNKLYLTPKAHTTQTATGNPITATITDGAGQIEDFQLDGDTYQQSYEGKNLLNCVQRSGTSQGITCVVSNTNTLTVTGKSTTSYADLTDIVYTNITAGTFTFVVSQALTHRLTVRALYDGGYVNAIIEPGDTYKTFTMSSDITGLYVYMATGGTGITFNETFTVQIVAGSTPDYDFEPYVGGIASPNPSYPQPIQVVTGEQTVGIVGKNLLNIKDNLKTSSNGLDFSFSDNKLVVSGTPTQTYATVTNEIDIDLPAGDYTFSISNAINHRVYIRVFYEDSTNADVFLINAGSTSRTQTLAKKAGRIRIDFSTITIGTAINESFALQLEKGSSASSYAPYSKTDYPISLGSIELCKLGTYQDYIYKDGDTWKVHKAVATYTFDDKLLSWQRNTQISGGYVMSYNVNNPLYGVLAVGTPSYSTKCTHFTIQNSSTTWTGVGKAGFNSFGAFWCMTNIADIDDFLEWLGEDNPELFYPLATPNDTAITDATLISQLNAIASASLENGSNTITNTATGSNLAGDMEVDYFGYDPTNRYDKWLWLDINNAYEKLGS